MTRKNCLACLLSIISALLICHRIVWAECTIDSGGVDRGERKAFLICGEGIPSNYTLEGLPEANITIDYEQHLGMCDVGVEMPGLYLILKAQNNATEASIRILDADTGQPVCEDLAIDMPDRIHVTQASLTKPRYSNLPFHILEIRGSQTQDLSQACVDGLSLPEGTWPTLSLVSEEDMEEIPPLQRLPLKLRLLWPTENGQTSASAVNLSSSRDQSIVCTEFSIRALVKVEGEQRYPAKIIISQVQGEEEKEGVAYAALPPPEWLSTMPHEDAKYVDVNGIRTRYFEKGKGDALLLIHGGHAGTTGTAQSWEQNFDGLSKSFHVYAIDLLGMGYTDNPQTDDDYKQYYTRVVEHVYGFIEAMGITKVHLIGHSQGAWPVTRIALDHPDMVKSIVSIGGIPSPSDPQRRTIPFMVYSSFFLHPPEGATLESIRRGKEMSAYSKNNITDEKVERSYAISHLPKMIEAEEQMAKFGMNPGHPSFRALNDQALEEIAEGKLKVPTLVLWGYNDPEMHHDVGIELFKIVTNSTVPASRLVMFDECGHSPHLEYPELFNKTIKSFCGTYSLPPIE